MGGGESNPHSKNIYYKNREQKKVLLRSLKLPCYYVPSSGIRIASIGEILRTYPDETVSLTGTELELSGSTETNSLTIPYCKESNLPIGTLQNPSAFNAQLDKNLRLEDGSIDCTQKGLIQKTLKAAICGIHTSCFKGPGLRYEVAVSIRGGDIVHVNGPYACGSWPDISIFREVLIHKLRPGEMVEADRGYRGEPTKIRTPVDAATRRQRKMKYRARACQETVNKRFKQFGILKQVYWHDIKKHKIVFELIVVITQLSLRHGEPQFGVHFY